MTNQEINKAIAEACGERYHKPTEEEVASGSYYQYEPDYCTDLNAMFEVEKTLMDKIVDCKPLDYAYGECLFEMLGGTYGPDGDDIGVADPHFALVHTTAAQRAEAFLRVLGKWEDAK